MSLPTYSGGSGRALTFPAYVPPPAPQPHLPGINWTKPVAARDDINATAATDQQLQMAAIGAPLRVTYGPDRIGADLANVLVYQNKLVLHLVWGEGEIQAIDALEMNDAALPAGVVATHYRGAPGQVVDPTLIAAFASIGIVFADDLPGIAHSVVVVPPNASEGFPTFTARIRGLKVYDPRTQTTVYSDSPALALADMQSNAVYGLNKTVDWSTVGAVADTNDELVGGEKRRLIGLTCASVSSASQWIETLRTYAGCFVVQGSLGVRLIADRPGSSTFSFGPAGNSRILAGSLKLKKRGGQQVPTVMRIEYTDTSKTPWGTGTAVIQAAGVDAGTTPRRESTVSLLGIQRYSQAWREGVERLNKLSLGDLELDFTGFSPALSVEAGDIVDVTSSIGLAAKMVRITTASNASPGRPRFSAVEYDPGMYSDAVQAEPTYADTTLPNPASPPGVGVVTAIEEVFQLENGLWSSRLKVTWPAVSYAYLRSYRVELRSQGELIASASPEVEIWRSSAVKEQVFYEVKVCAVSSIGVSGEWSQALLTPLGKSLIPSDVPSITVFEAGGRVYGSCGKATDIDILRYEWRYWPVGGGWATGTVIDAADALTMQSDTIPVGTWVIGVKAIDSVLQYSLNAKTATVVVTSDANSFFVDSFPSDSPTLTNMVSYRLTREDPNLHYITDDGVSWADKFPNAMSTYTNPLGTYHGSVTSTWLGEGEDFSQILGGQWTADAVVEALNGTYASYMGFTTDEINVPYTYLSGLSQKTNARFARIKHEAVGASTMIVTVPGQTIRLDAVPREENHSGTSSATHPVTVHLDNEYVSTKRITITATSATAVSTSPDNIGLDAPNPADKHANITITSTNTVTANTGAAWTFVRGRHSLPTTGKWYWESKINAVGANSRVMGAGICSRTASLLNTDADAASMFYYSLTGNRYPGAVAYGATYTTGDVIGIAYDADNGTVTFYKNNATQGAITGLTGEKFLAVGHYDPDASVTLRINKSDFSYTPPTGFKALPYGFDVGVFDAAGARVAREFLTNFQGV